MEQAYSILYNHLSFPHVISLLIVFIATLLIWHLIAKKTCGNEKKTCGNEKKTCGNEKKSLTHSLLVSLFVTYIFFILLITLIARTPAVNPDGTLNHRAELIPFWSWYEVIVNHSANRNYSRGLLVEIILNVVLFVPVGILGRSLNISFRRIFGISLSLFLSLAIELTQYFTCLGLCEIFDDVIGNTVGGVIGYGICECVRICVESRRRKN